MGRMMRHAEVLLEGRVIREKALPFWQGDHYSPAPVKSRISVRQRVGTWPRSPTGRYRASRS
jgi:hypothetical protein